eukprot:8571890-Pyramimonas_sp.AAC.1
MITLPAGVKKATPGDSVPKCTVCFLQKASHLDRSKLLNKAEALPGGGGKMHMGILQSDAKKPHT